MAESLRNLLEGLPAARSFIPLAAAISFAASGLLVALRQTRLIALLRQGAERALAGVVAALLLGMVFLSGLQILLRNLFDTGFLWIDPLLRHLVLLLAFSGALIATGLKRHVQINVLGRLIAGGRSRIVGASVAALSALVCLMLGHASLELLRDELDFVEVVFLNVPSWVVVGVFPASFLALAFRFCVLFFLEIVGEAPAAGAEGAEWQQTSRDAGDRSP